MANKAKLAFIGAGKMVTAIVSSLLRSQFFQADQIICCSANDGTSEKLAEATKIHRSGSPDEVLDFNPDLLVLGCKPQQISTLSSDLGSRKVESLVLSIMAGIPLDRLSSTFPDAPNIIRSMPNTPGQIGAGITGYVFANPPLSSDKLLVSDVLSSLGPALELKSEDDIDRVTAVSGSGPAYLFEFTCALEEAAKEIGLSHDLAHQFAIHTITGSAKLISESVLHPKELRNQVTSPNGTTQAALESFSSSALRKTVYKAVKAAHERSIELSNA
jgi:pyrroline-5-carboxylate reductase